MKTEVRSQKSEVRRIGDRTGFTLIEILTVITIIAILAGLLFPAIKAAMNKAKGARARTMIQQTGAAFRAYFTEFSRWPTNSAYNDPPFDLTTNLFRNAGSISFLDVPTKDIGNIGTSTNRVIDPWKQPYHCIVDGSNYVGYVQPPFSGSPTITSGYAIWSDGPDRTNNPSLAQDVGVNKDNIRSW